MNDSPVFYWLVGVFIALFIARTLLLIVSGVHRSKDDLEGLSRIRALIKSKSAVGYFLAMLTALQYALGFVLLIWLTIRILGR